MPSSSSSSLSQSLNEFGELSPRNELADESLQLNNENVTNNNCPDNSDAVTLNHHKVHLDSNHTLSRSNSKDLNENHHHPHINGGVITNGHHLLSPTAAAAVGEGLSETEITMEDADAPVDQFKNKRLAHYNEFKVLQALKNRNMVNDDDEEDEDDDDDNDDDMENDQLRLEELKRNNRLHVVKVDEADCADIVAK